MARIICIAFAWLILAFPGAGPTAKAEIAAADRATARTLIEGQLDAFRRGDGAGAFGFASPHIRALFSTADRFMAMVRDGYPALVDPQSVIFGELVEDPNGFVQTVYVTGRDGKSYLALYSLVRQDDGSWRIDGCVMVEVRSSAI